MNKPHLFALISVLILAGTAYAPLKPSVDKSLRAYALSQPRELKAMDKNALTDIQKQIETSGVVDKIQSSSRAPQIQQDVLNMVVQEYFGKVRSNKRAGSDLAGGGPITITVDDIHNYSFLTFSPHIEGLLGQDTGYIAVESKPSPADVTVDNSDKGDTPITIVASLGVHYVTVQGSGLHCTEPITVSKNQTSRLKCPK